MGVPYSAPLGKESHHGHSPSCSLGSGTEVHTYNTGFLCLPDLVRRQLGGQVQRHEIMNARIDLLQVVLVGESLFGGCNWGFKVGLR